MKQFIGLFLISLVFACTQGQSQQNLALAEFVTRYKSSENSALLDVRTPREWQQGVLPNSLTMNVMDKSFKQKIAKLDKNKTYYVYCKVGGRSAKASKMLKEMGFKKVYNLQNAGYEDLEQKGLK